MKLVAIEKTEESDLLSQWSTEYYNALHRYFKKRVPPHIEPEDLIQEVFTRLAKRSDLSEIEHIQGYIFQSAASVLADNGRRDIVRQRSSHEAFEEYSHYQEDMTLERVLIGKEALDHLIKNIYQLPDTTRQVFVLYHFENYRYLQIAKQLGIAVSTVEKHMARANAKLLKRKKPEK